MQDDPVTPGRVLAAINAMEGIGFVGQSFQIDQAGESAQFTAQRHFHRWLHQLCRQFDLFGG